MVELIIVGVIAIVSVGLSVRGLQVTSAQSAGGWQMAVEAHKEVLKLQAIRINTLENRLLANNWEEFANLQQVPDELSKVRDAEVMQPEHAFGDIYDDRLFADGVNQGVDLEGPTVG